MALTKVSTRLIPHRQSGSDHIHVIAEAVGFGSNPQYFSQVFKKYTGFTPSQFAENK